jgi:hypothetical protein
MVFPANNNRIVQVQGVTIYVLHTMFPAAENPICGSFYEDPFTIFSFLECESPAITSYKRRNRQVSNKAGTDLEIAKNSSGFSFAF